MILGTAPGAVVTDPRDLARFESVLEQRTNKVREVCGDALASFVTLAVIGPLKRIAINHGTSSHVNRHDFLVWSLSARSLFRLHSQLWRRRCFL